MTGTHGPWTLTNLLLGTRLEGGLCRGSVEIVVDLDHFPLIIPRHYQAIPVEIFVTWASSSQYRIQ